MTSLCIRNDMNSSVLVEICFIDCETSLNKKENIQIYQLRQGRLEE